MTVEFDDLVAAVITIGNCEKTVEICEPNIMRPLKLEAWMVKRTLVAWGLFLREAQEKS